MESTRAIGYSAEAAIADIIDNSISACANIVEIDFFPKGNPFIAILDNGDGMLQEDLIEAMQYGSRNPNEERESTDLGRYGLGMKTASLSQCRRLTVISKVNGSVSGCQWDLDHIRETNDWSLQILDPDDMQPLPSFEKLNSVEQGTLVLWQNLDKFRTGYADIDTAFREKIGAVKEHLALVFHRYLYGESSLKKLTIKFNSVPLKPKDPFLTKKSIQLMDTEVIRVMEREIQIRPYILPHISKLTNDELEELGGKEGLRRQQGFYVYRNKRLLIWGTWFRLMRQGDLSKMARVMVDIPNSLDELWTLDIKKSTAIPPEEVRKNLSTIIEKIAEGSKRQITHRAKREVGDDGIHLWNRGKLRSGGIQYAINRDYPTISDLVYTHPDIHKCLELILKQIESQLPLNSLYIDLTNDEKIENEVVYQDTKIVELLKSILDTYNIPESRPSLLARLIIAEPFSNYDAAINKAIERGEFL
ncbi:MAG: ATP-binding protein [Chloroflexota bacterium]